MGILVCVCGAFGGSKGHGPQGALVQQVVSYLGKPGAFNNLTQSFQQHGLGNILQSWIGKGNKLPISGDQVRKVFGNDTISEMASNSGLGEEETAEGLSSVLPQVVDKLTPDGKVPSGGQLNSLLSSAGKLFS